MVERNLAALWRVGRPLGVALVWTLGYPSASMAGPACAARLAADLRGFGQEVRVDRPLSRAAAGLVGPGLAQAQALAAEVSPGTGIVGSFVGADCPNVAELVPRASLNAGPIRIGQARPEKGEPVRVLVGIDMAAVWAVGEQKVGVAPYWPLSSGRVLTLRDGAVESIDLPIPLEMELVAGHWQEALGLAGAETRTLGIFGPGPLPTVDPDLPPVQTLAKLAAADGHSFLVITDGTPIPCARVPDEVGGRLVSRLQSCLRIPAGGPDNCEAGVAAIRPSVRATMLDPRFDLIQAGCDLEEGELRLRFVRTFPDLPVEEARNQVLGELAARGAAPHPGEALGKLVAENAASHGVRQEEFAQQLGGLGARWSPDPHFHWAFGSGQLLEEVTAALPQSGLLHHDLHLVRGTGPEGEPRWFYGVFVSRP